MDVFWTICIFFAWVVWFWLLITVFSDLFRRHDVGAGGKVLWTLFIVVLPFIGAFVYLISQGGGMAERNERRADEAKAQMDAYVRSAAGSGSPTAEIERAKRLLDDGTITKDEFEAMKAKALAAPAA